MNKTENNLYFILIKKSFFLFQVLDPNNKLIYSKEVPINYNLVSDIYISIENFLKKNIFTIEKNLKCFIKEIYIILESDLFFEAGSSIKQNSQKIHFEIGDIKDTLLEINNQFKKHSPRDEIIHMIIEKYIIGDNEYKYLPEQINGQNLIITVSFICLNNKIVNDLKKIFFKYQISVNKILSCNYLEEINDTNGENILEIAANSLNGSYINEVLIADKPSKNQGFFEKFFNFFN